MQIPNEILIPEIGKLVRQGHTVTLPLRGYSMRPYLEDNRDMGLLTSPPHTIRIGDVILAQTAPKRYALHRVVDIENDIITMCGDGNLTPEYVEYKDVVAIAIGFYRKGSKKLSPCDSTLYNIYWRMWVKLKFMRRWLLLMWRMLHYPKDTTKKIINRLCR